MRDHFASHPQWTPGRRYYTWFLTFEGHDDVRRLARQYQQHLHLANLTLVPLEWLHLTVQGVGDAAEVTESEADRIAAHARVSCARLTPLTITLGPARVAAEAVMLDISPPQPLAQLRQTLQTAIADVSGADHVPNRSDSFTPHVSLAYNRAERPAAPLIEVIEQVSTAPAAATITAAQLLILERDACVYHWHTHKTVALGQSPT